MADSYVHGGHKVIVTSQTDCLNAVGHIRDQDSNFIEPNCFFELLGIAAEFTFGGNQRHRRIIGNCGKSTLGTLRIWFHLPCTCTYAFHIKLYTETVRSFVYPLWRRHSSSYGLSIGSHFGNFHIFNSLPPLDNLLRTPLIRGFDNWWQII